jgi:hypothetical protein
MKLPSKSFDIRTAQQFLDYLVREAYDDAQGNQLSSRAAIAAAIFCWHLHEWVWAEHKTTLTTRFCIRTKDDLVQYLLVNCPEFEVIQGIANGSKHVHSQQKEPTSTTIGWAIFGTLALWSYTALTVEFKGNTVKFLDVLRACLEYWDTLFQKYLQ